jgi:hypothetical protein
MSKSVLIENALPLPAPDIEALIKGQTIAAIPRKLLDRGERFALYPGHILSNLLPCERYYRSNFLPIAQRFIANLSSETVTIKAWARCELCQMPDSIEWLNDLSPLTIWTTEALQQISSERSYFFLAHLRVYLLPQPIEMQVHLNAHNKKKKYVPLPHRLMVSDSTPVLSDRTFSVRRHQLENRLPPLHRELEELQAAVAQLNTRESQQLDEQIKIFLRWKEAENKPKDNPELAWIQNITILGDRSQELDEKKSNYQAGTDFENIVRKSLEFLGFTVDEAYKGGAGGLDLFCSKPYPLVGECKAGKGIGSRAAEELIKLGGMRLNEEQFKNAAKLIIGPGKPSTDVLTAAQKFGISIMNPISLQKLVELEAKYPRSINLAKLKKYLQPGQVDGKIDDYIENICREIELRSQIIEAVKELAAQDGETLDYTQKHFTVTEIRVHYNATRNPKLTDELVRDLLIELSSPLTGYLGRKKGSDLTSDRFYFLRDLKLD